MAHARRQSSGSREHCQDTRHPISIVFEFISLTRNSMMTSETPAPHRRTCGAHTRNKSSLLNGRHQPSDENARKNRPIRVSAKNEIIGGAARARRRGRAKGV